MGGLNNKTFKPCGFCFVEYAERNDARLAIDCLNLALLDGKRIRIDWDYGFERHRQFGRGRTGGQVRDEENNLKYNMQHGDTKKRFRSSVEDETEEGKQNG